MTFIALFSSLSRALMVRRPRATAEDVSTKTLVPDGHDDAVVREARRALELLERRRRLVEHRGPGSELLRGGQAGSGRLELAAETIFIDDVIFRMFLVEAMRIAISFSVAMDRRAVAWAARGASVLAARRAMVIFAAPGASKSLSQPARALALPLARWRGFSRQGWRGEL